MPSTDQQPLSDDWIPFIGSFEASGDTITLTSEHGNSLVIEKSNVQFRDQEIMVRNQCNVQVIVAAQETRLAECRCSNTIPATGRDEKIPKYGCETTCFGVVLVCHYCTYGPEGVLTGESSSICGACVGLPF